ncbi:MAG TPA: LLM class F420-dependent oxidoreductase [Ilumatobacter sp.]|nr:LLM class F420-dependent oxidoreductase [Ilumatobacter sp.]
MELADLRIFVEPQQGATYDDLLAVAQRAESLGYGAFFRSDHYLKMGNVTGLPGPTDAWITLAGIARETSTIRLGTMVTAATFRQPGPLAISVAGVDQMSDGRVELGFGAGWYEAEHTAYGMPFPSLGERFDNLEEQMEIIHGLWNTADDDTYNFTGKLWQVQNSPALPKPVQAGGPPLIVGGHGKHRTPRLAARYAQEFNLPFSPLETFISQRDAVSSACETEGRDPDSMIYSAALVLCCGTDEAEVTRRAAAIGREPAELRVNGAAGTPDEVAEMCRRWRDAGADRLYLQVLDLSDLEHMDLVAAAVAPLLAA